METPIRNSDFIFDCVHLFYYKCHKVNLNPGGSFTDFPDWIKNKKATKNPINKKDNKCFQYARTVTLSHEEIGNYPEKITQIKPFIHKYSRKRNKLPIRKK